MKKAKKFLITSFIEESVTVRIVEHRRAEMRLALYEAGDPVDEPRCDNFLEPADRLLTPAHLERSIVAAWLEKSAERVSRKMRRVKKILRTFFMVCACIWLLYGNGFAQGSEFTYQGKLTSGGSPSNGSHDFEFLLFDSLSGGTQVGAAIAVNNVVVTDGSFSVKLDFGNQFPGSNRFLEVRVRVSGPGGHTILTPRQQINSTPYSVKSISAENATNATTATTAGNALQLGGVPSSQYVLTGDPRMADARTPLPGSSDYIQNQNTGPQSSSNFNISGTGRANILSVSTQFNIGSNRILSATSDGTFVGILAGPSASGDGNSFFGRRAGLGTTIGAQNAFFGIDAGSSNDTGSINTFIGSFSGRSNSSGNLNTFLGYFAGDTNAVGSSNTVIGSLADVGAANLTNSAAIGWRSLVTQSNSLVLGSIGGVNGAPANTNVGIGTTAPTERLHVVGNGVFTGNLSVNGTFNATLPSGSSSYIQNTTTQQTSSSFNISGTGTAVSFNATLQYNIGGNRVLAGTDTNLFAGINAGLAEPTGGFNTFLGSSAGRVNTAGASNTFVGAAAGFSNTLGGSNTFLGEFAGSVNTSGDVNVFIGSRAGDTNTTGRANTVIGASADAGANNLVNATAIGAGSRVDSSNSMVLGSINGINGANSNVKVGIGTTTPAALLHIGVGSGRILLGDPDCDLGFAGIGFAATLSGCTNYSLLGNGTHTFLNRPIGGGLFFRENNADQMVIASGGNVGIGTQAPGSKLHITDNGGNIMFGGGGCDAGFTGIGFASSLTCTNYSLLGNGTDTFVNAPSTGNLFFRIGNSTKASIDPNGNFDVGPILIGRQTCQELPRAIIRLRTTDSCVTAALSAFGTTTNVGTPESGSIKFWVGTNNPATVLPSGMVVEKLGVTLDSVGSTSVCRNGSGNLAMCSSSARYKSNISYFRSGLDLIGRLRPVSFDWKEGGMRDMGLVAEDVAKVEPLLVTHNKDGQVEGVKYDRLGVVLVNAVKEQQSQIVELRKQNEELKKKLDLLTRIVCSQAPSETICQ